MLKLCRDDPSAGTHTESVLYLCDLAGSEMVGKTYVTGEQLREAGSINLSLTTLGLVINKLTDKSATHIPYRDSRLTRLLENALGGNSNTALLITCSPSPDNFSETLSTLRFGSRAKSIQQTARVNVERSLDELKRHCERLEKEVGACGRILGELRCYALAGVVVNSKKAKGGVDVVGSLVQRSLTAAPPDVSKGGDPKYDTHSGKAVWGGNAHVDDENTQHTSLDTPRQPPLHTAKANVEVGRVEDEEDEEEEDEEEDDEEDEEEESQKRMEMMLLRLKSSLQSEKASKEALAVKELELEELQKRLKSAKEGSLPDALADLQRKLEDRDIYIATLHERIGGVPASHSPAGLRTKILGGGAGDSNNFSPPRQTSPLGSFMGDSPQDIDIDAGNLSPKNSTSSVKKKTFLGSLLSGIKERLLLSPRSSQPGAEGGDGLNAVNSKDGGSPHSGRTSPLVDVKKIDAYKSRALAFFGACEAGLLTDVKALLKAAEEEGLKDALVSAQDRSGRSAVLYAARGGTLDTLSFLLSQGADIQARDKDARSALAYAARRGHVDVGSWLLASGLQADQSDVHGLTPLHQAVLAKSGPMTELFLCSGADVTAQDSNGLTPYKLAKRFLSMESPESRGVLISLQEFISKLSEQQRVLAGWTEARIATPFVEEGGGEDSAGGGGVERDPEDGGEEVEVLPRPAPIALSTAATGGGVGGDGKNRGGVPSLPISAPPSSQSQGEGSTPVGFTRVSVVSSGSGSGGGGSTSSGRSTNNESGGGGSSTASRAKITFSSQQPKAAASQPPRETAEI